MRLFDCLARPLAIAILILVSATAGRASPVGQSYEFFAPVSFATSSLDENGVSAGETGLFGIVSLSLTAQDLNSDNNLSNANAAEISVFDVAVSGFGGQSVSFFGLGDPNRRISGSIGLAGAVMDIFFEELNGGPCYGYSNLGATQFQIGYNCEDGSFTSAYGTLTGPWVQSAQQDPGLLSPVSLPASGALLLPILLAAAGFGRFRKGF